MRYVDVINRPYVPAVNLDVFTRTLDTLQQGHIKGLELKSQLDTAIANLDMNSAEDEFKANLINGIQNEVNANAEGWGGNMYYGIADLIKKQGDIAKNPAVIGRLKAQQEYKKYQAQIDARQDLSQDAKDWAKEKNPYKYEDKYDENGNVIGGTEWTPDFTPVESKDFNDIFKLALTYAAKEHGGGSSATFVDADGNPTKNVTGAIAVLSTTTGKWERLSEDKIKSAIEAAMSANPQYEASLHQDWEVLKWKWDKGDRDSSLKDPITGLQKNYSQYKRDIIDPFVRAASYYNSTSSTNYNSSALGAVEAARQARSGKSGNGISQYGDPTGLLPSGAGYNATITDDTKSKSFVTVGVSKNRVKDYINKISDGKNINLTDLDVLDRDSLRTRLTSAGFNDNQISDILNYATKEYAENKEAYDLYDSIMSDGSKASAGQIMRYVINNGLVLDEDELSRNSYLRGLYDDYQKIVNNRFLGAENYSFATKNKQLFDNVISSLGVSEDAVRELGYNIGKDGNRYTISINRDHSNLIGQLEGAVQNGYNSSSRGYKFRQHFARAVGSGDGFYAYNDGGKKISTQTSGVISEMVSRIKDFFDGDANGYYSLNQANVQGYNQGSEEAARTVAGNIVNAIPTFVRENTRISGLAGNQSPAQYVAEGIGILNDRMQRIGARNLADDEKVISTQNYSGISPRQNSAYENMLNAKNSNEYTYWKHIYDAENLTIDNLLNSGSALNTNVYRMTDDGNRTRLDSSEKLMLNKLINDEKITRSYSMNYNPFTGEVTPQITLNMPKGYVNPFTQDDSPIIFTSDVLINDRALRELNRSEEYKVSSQLYRNDLNNINTTIGYYIDDDGNHNYELTPAFNYEGKAYRRIVNENGTELATISEAQAQNILLQYNFIKEISKGNYSDEEIEKVVQPLVDAFTNNPLLLNIFGEDILTQMVSTYFS